MVAQWRAACGCPISDEARSELFESSSGGEGTVLHPVPGEELQPSRREATYSHTPRFFSLCGTLDCERNTRVFRPRLDVRLWHHAATSQSQAFKGSFRMRSSCGQSLHLEFFFDGSPDEIQDQEEAQAAEATLAR